jgi:hypothetical protein
MTAASRKRKRSAADRRQATDLRPIGDLELLPGDEVEFENLVLAVYVGWLAAGHAFRQSGADGFVWHAAGEAARVLRSPNRERRAAQVEDGGEVDPLRDARK